MLINPTVRFEQSGFLLSHPKLFHNELNLVNAAVI